MTSRVLANKYIGPRMSGLSGILPFLPNILISYRTIALAASQGTTLFADILGSAGINALSTS